jgi:peptidyl-tRNA hydrolase
MLEGAAPNSDAPPQEPTAGQADALADPQVVGEPEEDPIVQFVVVRRDLLKTMEWPVGSVMAQACHACLAVVHQNLDDSDVQAYLAPENIDSMHKVIKECKGEPQLRTLAEKLAADNICHKLWMEQPEDIPTAIALKPYPRSRVAPLLKKYQLYR